MKTIRPWRNNRPYGRRRPWQIITMIRPPKAKVKYKVESDDPHRHDYIYSSRHTNYCKSVILRRQQRYILTNILNKHPSPKRALKRTPFTLTPNIKQQHHLNIGYQYITPIRRPHSLRRRLRRHRHFLHHLRYTPFSSHKEFRCKCPHNHSSQHNIKHAHQKSFLPTKSRTYEHTRWFPAFFIRLTLYLYLWALILTYFKSIPPHTNPMCSPHTFLLGGPAQKIRIFKNQYNHYLMVSIVQYGCLIYQIKKIL